jgi:hypothetical protein
MDAVDDLLHQDGAVLTRQRKHEVWKLSNGHTFVRSSTPSDYRATLNQLSDLRKALGIADPDRGKPGERRVTKVATTRPTTMRDALVAADIVEPVETTLRREIHRLENELDQVRGAHQEFKSKCWCQRVRKLWRRAIIWLNNRIPMP